MACDLDRRLAGTIEASELSSLLSAPQTNALSIDTSIFGWCVPPALEARTTEMINGSTQDGSLCAVTLLVVAVEETLKGAIVGLLCNRDAGDSDARHISDGHLE